jgi:two-component system, response regulator
MERYRADVVLVEDDPADAELILESLGADGMAQRVHVAPDGEDALDYVFCRAAYAGRPQGELPRLFILDINATKVGGLDVLRQLKLDARTATIPVVMLTSSNLLRDVAAGYELGANSYVQKPVDFTQFRETVRLLGVYWLSINEPPPPSVASGPEITRPRA